MHRSQVSRLVLHGPLAALLLFAGCESNVAPLPKLQALGSCADVETAMRDAAIRRMEQRLMANLRSALEYPGSCGRGGWLDDSYGGAPNAGAEEGGGAPGEYTGTNNQVGGVDEADFVKTDGQYIYVGTGSTLRIVDSWPAQSATVVSQVAIEGEVKSLLQAGDRVLVASSIAEGAESSGGWYDRPCTYGYNCSFTGDGHPTKVTILDVSDRGAPVVTRELWFSGSLLAARRIDSAIYAVLSSPGSTLPWVPEYPEDSAACTEGATPLQIRMAFYVQMARNRTVLREAPIGDFLPTVKERVGGVMHEDLLASCEGFYAPEEGDGEALTTVAGIDLESDIEPVRFATIVSQPGAVYSSAEALYLAVPQGYDAGYYDGSSSAESRSDLHKFRLQPEAAQVHYTASGSVKGRALNQFAMDEQDGYLRIATTSGHVPDPAVHSTLSVLDEIGTDLVTVGVIDDIAPEEDIRSVRFDGDRGFVVTFKKTDPLFLFDLSSPEEPRLLSELKIPGFSTYMHMMDATHLLAIGYDADDQGDFAWFQGVLLQVFDVTDPEAPSLLHRDVIGTRGSSSEALTNHLAFTYYASHGLLALPLTICEESAGGGSYGETMTFSGLIVYDATVADGFSEHGRVAHPPADDVSCGNWWTDATSQVKRSIFMDDYVFSISEQLIKVNRLDDLATDLVQLPLI